MKPTLLLAALLLAMVAPACSGSTSAGPVGACSLNSDCAMGLICALGKCRKECASAADCAAGGACVDDGRTSACQTPEERNTPCARPSDCAPPLACASDYRCRNLCFSDADCNVLGITNRVCAHDANGVDFCADPAEVSAGAITATPPPGAPTTPVVEPANNASAPTLDASSDALIGASVGSQGGVLGAAEVTVSIPSGALTSPIALTIEPAAGTPGPAGAVSAVYEIGPTGTLFAQPVSIAFAYTAQQLGGAAPSDFAVETMGPGGQWVPLSQIVVDVQAQTIAGQTSHLSPYVLVHQQVGMIATAGDSGSSGVADASANATPDAQLSSGGDDGGGTVVMGGDSGSGGGPKDSSVPADAAASIDAGGPVSEGGAPGGGDGSISFPDGSAGGTDAGPAPDAITMACPSAPAQPTLATSMAMSPNATIAGGTFNAVDGYAMITESFNAGLYVTQLTLVFSEYPDASGYFTVGADHGNARTLTMDVMPQMGTTPPPPPGFTTSTYPMQSMQLDTRGGGCSSVPYQCTANVDSTVGIMAITQTEIMGSASVFCNPVPDASTDIANVTFDLPLFVYGASGPPTPACCLPLFAP
jgi:hypothetical protein